MTYILGYGGYYFDPYDDEDVYSEYKSIANYNVYSLLKKTYKNIFFFFNYY